MALDLRYALPQFSARVLGEIEKRPKPSQALRQFFPEREVATRGVQLWKTRFSKPTAKSVDLQEKGIVTRLDKNSQEVFIPPLFNYKFDYSALDEFEPVMGATGQYVEGDIYAKLVQNTALGVSLNLDRIERAEQLQMMNALENGVVEMHGSSSLLNIDFHRKAASIVAYNASFGFDQNVNPSIIMRQGAEFLDNYGNVDPSQPINVIMGSDAWEAFRSNTVRQAEGDIKDQMFMNLSTGAPIQGLTPHGSYSAGNYRFNLWGMSDWYDHPITGVRTAYMNPKKIIMLPNTPSNEIVYGGTTWWTANPYTDKNARPKVIKGKRNFYEIRDIEAANIQYGVKSAPIPLLGQEDQVFTAQVVAP